MESQEQLVKKIEDIVNEHSIQMVFSNPREKSVISKVKVRPVLIKHEIMFQVSRYIGTKVFHENMTEKEMQKEALRLLETEFKQGQITTEEEFVTILGNKKGEYTILSKQQSNVRQGEFSHNRKKNYILKEGNYVPFLEDLGVMTRDGKIIKSKYDKFRQINRFLEFIEDVLP